MYIQAPLIFFIVLLFLTMTMKWSYALFAFYTSTVTTIVSRTNLSQLIIGGSGERNVH